jgi:hypothetical protein
MLSLRFEGWFQCRLATDPDPSDEPRGVSGSTFALPGEPHLDGVIRFHNPVAPRSHGPQVGVWVTEVKIGGMLQETHPLRGAAVNLIGSRFEERNGIIARRGEAVIHPFEIEVAASDVTLRRSDLWDLRRPELTIDDVPPELLKRRQPQHTGRGLFEMNSAEVADATGIADFQRYFQERKRLLEYEYDVTSDEVSRVAIRKRIADIDGGEWQRLFRLGFRVEYGFDINGRPEVHDTRELLNGTVLTSTYWLPQWPIRLWMGGFDSDALCAYIRGTLDIPFAVRSGS